MKHRCLINGKEKCEKKYKLINPYIFKAFNDQKQKTAKKIGLEMNLPEIISWPIHSLVR